MSRRNSEHLPGTIAGWELSRPSDARPISVLIADSQPPLADALAQALDWWPNLEVMDEHPSCGEAAVQAVATRRPNVALLDYWLEGMDAPAAVRLTAEGRSATTSTTSCGKPARTRMRRRWPGLVTGD